MGDLNKKRSSAEKSKCISRLCSLYLFPGTICERVWTIFFSLPVFVDVEQPWGLGCSIMGREDILGKRALFGRISTGRAVEEQYLPHFNPWFIPKLAKKQL